MIMAMSYVTHASAIDYIPFSLRQMRLMQEAYISVAREAREARK